MQSWHLKKIIILSSLILFAFNGCKQKYSGISLGSFTGRGGEINLFSGENYGYVIYDIGRGEIVRGHNIRSGFTPASVSKLFTALFAVESLGADYRFRTTLSFSGKISGDIMNGDLCITGGGDPELSVDGLQTLVSALKSRNIRELKGNLYYDESLFSPSEKINSGMPDEAFYNTGISPLSFNGNVIYALHVKNSVGKIISADMLPSLPSFSAGVYSGKPDYPFIRYSYINGIERWMLPDRYLWDARHPLPVKHPAKYTAEVFRKLCSVNGITLPSPSKGEHSKSAETVAEVSSRPLKEILREMIFTSNNLTAEIINSVAAAAYKNSGYDNTGATAIESFYRKNFTAVDWDSFRMINPSGLSTLNRATPEQTAAVLLFLERNRKEKPPVEELLPLSGWDGTMKNRLENPSTALRVYGKTGSIFYASALAGIFHGKSGKRYIYSIFINDPAKRREYDANSSRTEKDINAAGLWSKNAADAIDRFLLKMIEAL